MARSLFRDTICLRGPGGLIPLAGAQVWFYEPNGAGVPGPAIAYPLYPDAHSTNQLPVPYVTGALGELEVWADLPHRAQIVAVKAGFANVSETIDLEYPPEMSASTEDIANAIQAHEDEADPHDQYLTQDEADLAYLKLTGGTITGPLTAPKVVINDAAATNRFVEFNTGGSPRWWMGANAAAESGANAGSDFSMFSLGDDGSFIGSPFTIYRATSTAVFSGALYAYGDKPVLINDSADLRYEQLSRKGAASGYVPLGADTKIPNAYLPDLAITNTFVVTSEAEMLALNAQTGDVCVRLDTTENYILAAEPATVLANWTKLAASTTAGNTTIVKREEFAPAATSTAVALAAVPTQMLSVSRNGVEQSQPAGHYTVAGVTVTFTDAFVAGERVSVVYEVGSSAPAPINGYTKLESDARYLPFTGGTLTGGLNANAGVNVSGVLAYFGDLVEFRATTTGTSLFRIRPWDDASGGAAAFGVCTSTAGAWKWRVQWDGSVVQDGSLAVAGPITSGGSPVLTQTTGDARYLQSSVAATTYLPLAGGTLTGLLTSQALTPDTTNSRDLGALAMRYRSGYFGTVLSIAGASATANQITHAITTDAQPRLIVDGNGKMRWGPGAAVAQDTSLERTGVGALQVLSNLGVGVAPMTDSHSSWSNIRFGTSGQGGNLMGNNVPQIFLASNSYQHTAGWRPITGGSPGMMIGVMGTSLEMYTLASVAAGVNQTPVSRFALSPTGGVTLTPDTGGTTALVAYGPVNIGSAPFAGYGCVNVNIPTGMSSLLTGYVRYGVDIAPSVAVQPSSTGITVASINAGLLGSSGAGSVMDNAYAAILSGPSLTNGGTISNAAALYVTNPTTGGAVAQNRVIIHGNTGASLTTAGAWTNAPSWLEGKSDVRYVEGKDVALFADWFTMGWKPARYRYPALTEVEKSRAVEGNPVLRPVTNESEYDHFFTILDEVPQEVREVICVDDTGIISTKDMDGFLAALLQHALQRIVALEAKVNG